MTRGEYDVKNEEEPPSKTNGNALYDNENHVETIENKKEEKPYVGFGFKEVIRWIKFAKIHFLKIIVYSFNFYSISVLSK